MIYLIGLILLIYLIFNMKYDNRLFVWYIFLMGLSIVWNSGILLFFVLLIVYFIKG